MSAIAKTPSALDLVRSLPKAGVDTTVTVNFIKDDRKTSGEGVVLCLTGEACRLKPDVLGYSNTEKFALRNLQRWAQRIAVDFALSYTHAQRVKKYGFRIRNKNIRSQTIKSVYDNVDLRFIESCTIDFKVDGKEHLIDLTDTDWSTAPITYGWKKQSKPVPRLCVPALTEDFIAQLIRTPAPTTSTSKKGATEEEKLNAKL